MERESCAKTKTEMGLVTAMVVLLAWPCPRGPSAATHRSLGHSSGQEGSG